MLRASLRVGFEQANFIHNVHLSILEPTFVRYDISFINLAFPRTINQFGSELSPKVAALMIEFYALVPDDLKSEITWHPSDALRRLAERNEGRRTG